jgi:hypothetical protein
MVLLICLIARTVTGTKRGSSVQMLVHRPSTMRGGVYSSTHNQGSGLALDYTSNTTTTSAMHTYEEQKSNRPQTPCQEIERRERENIYMREFTLEVLPEVESRKDSS